MIFIYIFRRGKPIRSRSLRSVGFSEASKCYDPTGKEYYYGYGCTIVSTRSKIPIEAEFTESKQAPEETARCITRDALAVVKPI